MCLELKNNLGRFMKRGRQGDSGRQSDSGGEGDLSEVDEEPKVIRQKIMFAADSGNPENEEEEEENVSSEEDSKSEESEKEGSESESSESVDDESEEEPEREMQLHYLTRKEVCERISSIMPLISGKSATPEALQQIKDSWEKFAEEQAVPDETGEQKIARLARNKKIRKEKINDTLGIIAQHLQGCGVTNQLETFCGNFEAIKALFVEGEEILQEKIMSSKTGGLFFKYVMSRDEGDQEISLMKELIHYASLISAPEISLETRTRKLDEFPCGMTEDEFQCIKGTRIRLQRTEFELVNLPYQERELLSAHQAILDGLFHKYKRYIPFGSQVHFPPALTYLLTGYEDKDDKYLIGVAEYFRQKKDSVWKMYNDYVEDLQKGLKERRSWTVRDTKRLLKNHPLDVVESLRHVKEILKAGGIDDEAIAYLQDVNDEGEVYWRLDRVSPMFAAFELTYSDHFDKNPLKHDSEKEIANLLSKKDRGSKKQAVKMLRSIMDLEKERQFIVDGRSLFSNNVSDTLASALYEIGLSSNCLDLDPLAIGLREIYSVERDNPELRDDISAIVNHARSSLDLEINSKIRRLDSNISPKFFELFSCEQADSCLISLIDAMSFDEFKFIFENKLSLRRLQYHPRYDFLRSAMTMRRDFMQVLQEVILPKTIGSLDKLIEFIPFEEHAKYLTPEFITLKQKLVEVVQKLFRNGSDGYEEITFRILKAFEKSKFSSKDLMWSPNPMAETLLHTVALMENPKAMCAVIDAGIGVKDLLEGRGATVLEIASPRCKDRLNEYRAFGKISLAIADVIANGNPALMQSPAEKDQLTDIIFHSFVKCYDANIIEAKEALRLEMIDLNSCPEAVLKTNPYIQLVSQKIALDLLGGQEMSSSSSSAAVSAAVTLQIDEEKIRGKIYSTKYCHNISDSSQSSSSSSAAAETPTASASSSSVVPLQIEELSVGKS